MLVLNDKVAVYNDGKRLVGRVTEVISPVLIGVAVHEDDDGGNTIEVHPKQCSKIKTVASKEFFVNIYGTSLGTKMFPTREAALEKAGPACTEKAVRVVVPKDQKLAA